MTTHARAAATTTVTAGGLLFKKMLTAFLVGFLPTFITGITGALQSVLDSLSHGGSISFPFLQATVLGIVVGAVMAGVRALLAFLPVNITPTDKLIGFGSKVRTLTVTRK